MNATLTAVNLSGPEASELLALPENTRLISICEEERQWDLKIPLDMTFPIVFHDARHPVSYRDQYYVPISDRQGFELAEYIKENRTSNFIVHCNAGVSRSAAVCLFISRNYGHSLKPKFWESSSPNPLVFGILQVQHELSKES